MLLNNCIGHTPFSPFKKDRDAKSIQQADSLYTSRKSVTEATAIIYQVWSQKQIVRMCRMDRSYRGPSRVPVYVEKVQETNKKHRAPWLITSRCMSPVVLFASLKEPVYLMIFCSG
jgi:hypothetical protein